MGTQIRLDEDWYVLTEFTRDPRNVHRAVALAEARELKAICLVERVRQSSDWIGDFAAAVRLAGHGSPVEVRCAVEAELLDAGGLLDAPAAFGLVDCTFPLCGALPAPRGPMALELAREEIAAGRLLPAKAAEWLVRALVGAVHRHDDVALIRPFEILPAIGLDQRHLHPPVVRWLAAEMAARGARCVLDERLCCPEPWVVDCLLAAGVTVSASSGCRMLAGMGSYEWCRELANSSNHDSKYSVPTYA